MTRRGIPVREIRAFVEDRMKRQTRMDFDAKAVRDYLASFGEHPVREPEQGWASLVDEACNRMVMLEGIIVLLRDTAEANRRATEACISPLLGPYRPPETKG